MFGSKRTRAARMGLLLLVSATLMVLSGCSIDTSEPAQSDLTAPTASAEPTNSTPLVLDAASQDLLDWDWEQVLRESPDAERPVIEIVRFTDSDDWASAMESCMNDLGWPDRATADGGLDHGMIQDAQAGAHALAIYTCNAKYPMDPKYNVPLTDERLSELFDYFTDELQPCLEAEGYDVPESPSRETFIDTYAENGAWHLYENVSTGQSTWNSINAKCPQIPVDFYE
ncbi:hypothetical protein E3T55_10940 [Cryobacterium frigoriphilum]|uniref:Uncharacterized protein n=1 Tax=Cryobacterium frigoriphilum TaxID=1259150 RepID=A0A4R9A000_9MICO|nr:hypothetical protein [Cryobacterium frigoriphilum]TFD49587.1 hypothetical protein E3T55_10940 [Cryobacterium frigoriphilum]